ncbi:MAG: hypothetical protein KJ736_11065 [Candidatus Omnitrophica bacterium]|nr:hypothetical protein [Candidatus Omnitrophota bacterium]
MHEDFEKETNFKISEILKDAFCLCRDNLIPFVLIAASGFILQILSLPELGLSTKFMSNFWLYRALGFAQTMIYFCMTAVLMFDIFQKINGLEPSLTEVLISIRNKLIKYIIVTGLFNIILIVGFIVLVIPGVYMMIVFGFVGLFVLLEHASITESFKESFNLVSGNFWKILGLSFIVLLIYVPVIIILRIFPNYWFSIVVQIIFTPWLCSISVYSFIKLKEIKAQRTYVREISLNPKKDIKEIIIFGLLLALIYLAAYFVFSFLYMGGGRVCPLSSKSEYIKAVEFEAPKLMSMDPKSSIIEEETFIIYVPSKIDLKKKYPLVIALSPNADANSMLNALKSSAEKNKWIVYASKEFKNNVSMTEQLFSLMVNLDWVNTNFPVNESQIIAAGFSGGGMGAHAFAYHYPDTVRGVIVNTGMLHDYYMSPRESERYPREKKAVLIASPTDFRYEEMIRDKEFLEGFAWDVKWIEFEGGHKIATDKEWGAAVEWLDNQMNRAGQREYEDVPVAQEEIKLKRNGKVQDYYDDGKLLNELYYVEGKRQGEYKAYYRSGALWSEGVYIDDLKDGLFKVFNEDGSLQTEINYYKGKYHGQCKFYNEDGLLEFDDVYEEGQRVSRMSFNKEGVLKQSVKFKNGKKHWIEHVYRGKDILEWEMNYNMGKLQGITKYYDKDGDLEWIMNYSNNERDGQTIMIDKQGKVVMEYIYSDGRLKNYWSVEWQKFSRNMREFFKKFEAKKTEEEQYSPGRQKNLNE